MVNYGRSRACLTCKNRKVKCDQLRPGCQRCSKIGKPCPGYQDEWDLAIRHENAAVARKVHGAASSSSSSISNSPSPSQGLAEDLEISAVDLFFTDYVLAVCGPSPGWLDFLPELYGQSADDSLLRLAVCTVAYAHLAQKHGKQDFSIKAIACYQQILGVMSEALVGVPGPVNEATMTAVILLGLYENISSDAVENAWPHHVRGLGALADMRRSQLMEGNGPNLLQIVCCQMQRRNLDLELFPGPIDERLIGLLDTSLSSRMIKQHFEVSKYIARVKQDLLYGNLCDDWYHSLFIRLQQLELQFQRWNSDASIYIRTSTTPKCKGRHPASKTIESNTYFGPWTLSLWNKTRSGRIITHQKFLEALDTCQDDSLLTVYKEQRLSSEAIIRNMTTDILRSIAFSLEYRSVGGYFLVWSLQVVLRCSYASFEQRKEARESLERVGRECGLNYAVIYARHFGPDSMTDLATCP